METQFIWQCWWYLFTMVRLWMCHYVTWNMKETGGCQRQETFSRKCHKQNSADNDRRTSRVKWPVHGQTFSTALSGQLQQVCNIIPLEAVKEWNHANAFIRLFTHTACTIVLFQLFSSLILENIKRFTSCATESSSSERLFRHFVLLWTSLASV